MHLDALGCTQVPSDALNCNQRPYDALRITSGNQRPYLLGFLQLLWDENDNQSQSHGNQRPLTFSASFNTFGMRITISRNLMVISGHYLLGFLQLLLDLLLARRALYLDAHSVPNARRNP